MRRLRQVRLEGEAQREVDEEVQAASEGVFAALHDDLNVPRARARLFELLRFLNGRIAQHALTRRDAELALDFLLRLDRILSVLDLNEEGADVDQRIEALLAERDAARSAQNYARADALRVELAGLGVTLEDTPTGARVSKRSRH